MVGGPDSLKLMPFTQDRMPNHYPGGKLPWQVYHTVRNALVRTCRRFGPTGPMGLVRIVPDVENRYEMLADDLNLWEAGDPDLMYYILDDPLNHERSCYAELYGADPFSAGWLLAVTQTLRRFDGWGLGVNNIPDSYVLIFGDRLLVKGRLARCRSASEVVETATRLLRRGDKRWWQFWR